MYQTINRVHTLKHKMRVVAQNKYGTTYGNWINFRTKGAIEPDRSPIINSSIATPNTPLSLWNSVKYDFSYRNELKGIQGLLNNNLYVYDSEGNRAKATVGGVSMYYPSKLYSRISSSDKTKYIYVNNSLIATVRTVDSTTTPYYIHTDHLGSTNAVSNSTGTVAELLDYYSYGSDKTSTGSCDIRRKYIGEYCDNDTSLAYLNARYYNSYSGRFISQDPMFWSPEKFLMDPQQLNSYSYARNNPIVYRDPSGQFGISSVPGLMVGLGTEAYNTVEGLASMILHPIDTVEGLANFAVNTIEHPVDTFNSFMALGSSSLDEFLNSSDYNQGKMMGEGIFFIGSMFVGGGEVSGASKLSKVSKIEKAGEVLSDSAKVCRGGLCDASRFIKGKGVTMENSKLYGVSVNAGDVPVSELTKSISNSRYGVTTVGDIRKLGGDVIAAPSNNVYHSIVNGLTPEQLERLFTPTIKNY